jgi:hypothetical protein
MGAVERKPLWFVGLWGCDGRAEDMAELQKSGAFGE